MKLLIRLSHLIFGTRRFQNKNISKIGKSTKGKKIIELGSGKRVDGKYFYSMKRYFDLSNNFIMTDINPKFGHKIYDITKTKDKNEYDMILCLNVLEHVFDFQKAIDNLYSALKNKGKLILIVPGYYPLHDEPCDYWRFTEHALRKLLQDKFDIKLKHHGLRKYPIAYFIEAIKK